MLWREYLVICVMILSLIGISFYLYPIERLDSIQVDLNDVVTTSVKLNNSREDVVYFSFDLRLSPKAEIEIYAPLMDYLSAKVGKQFRIKFAQTYEEVQYMLGTGEVSFAAIGPVNYVVTQKKYGNVIPIVIGLDSNKSPVYRAAIITRPDSNIMTLEDIKNRSFAFGSFYSTQGHLIPRIMLERAGVKLEDLERYAFLGSHQACAQAVISGLFDAGGVQDTLAFHLESKGLVRIVALSEPYPRSMIVANKNIEPELIEKVKSALLELDPLGKDANLTDWDKTEFSGGFKEVNQEFYRMYFELVGKYIMGEFS